jgi:hypothetical protein
MSAEVVTFITKKDQVRRILLNEQLVSDLWQIKSKIDEQNQTLSERMLKARQGRDQKEVNTCETLLQINRIKLDVLTDMRNEII